MKWSPKTVILLGHGVRAAGAADLAPRLLEFGVPILTSWQAKDLVDNDHPNYYGSPGIYGNRHANAALAAADMILAIGNRMSIWNVGYEGPRPDQRVVLVDVDEAEAKKCPHAEWVHDDALVFIVELINGERPVPWSLPKQPLIESPTHDDRDGYPNSYRFIDRLNAHLLPDQVITIDCGSAAACAFQALRVRPPMRVLSSGGLGEMGCALPYAVGASFARGKGEVLCLVGDGALMLNLQELQTIVHHQLPVKIIVFRNESYLMIRHTERLAGMKESGIDAPSGVSFPDYRRLALTFGMTAAEVRTWDDFDRVIPGALSCEGPCLVEYFMHPRQVIAPKLDPIYIDGKATSPKFDEMSPCL